uniref:Uncharacterized protein n=1 Tax=Ditylenchus dipsaci TaxID=166011 RepID=A0A915ERB2_9BILA
MARAYRWSPSNVSTFALELFRSHKGWKLKNNEFTRGVALCAEAVAGIPGRQETEVLEMVTSDEERMQPERSRTRPAPKHFDETEERGQAHRSAKEAASHKLQSNGDVRVFKRIRYDRYDTSVLKSLIDGNGAKNIFVAYAATRLSSSASLMTANTQTQMHINRAGEREISGRHPSTHRNKHISQS